MSAPAGPRRFPELLLGLLALALVVAIVVPVSALIVMSGVRDVKRTRDKIVVTGSARQPIEANLAIWHLTVSARERTPAEAARSVREKTAAVERFLSDGGIPEADVSKPPLVIEETSIREPTGLKKPAFRAVQAWRVSQTFRVSTKEIDRLERTAGKVDELLLAGVDLSVESIQYLSTELTEARFAALRKATADARRRADTIAGGLGGHLGAVRNVNLGVYQITPRNSTDVSDYGINDTSSRDKDVTAVVTVTFAVE